MNILYTDNLELGTAVLTYMYKKGDVLPKVGDIIKDEKCRMEVIESNNKKHYIRVLLTSTESVSTRMERYVQEIEDATHVIAKKLYRSSSSGMTALIGWDDISEEEQNKYFKMAKETVDYLNEKELLILKS